MAKTNDEIIAELDVYYQNVHGAIRALLRKTGKIKRKQRFEVLGRLSVYLETGENCFYEKKTLAPGTVFTVVEPPADNENGTWDLVGEEGGRRFLVDLHLMNGRVKKL